ncbi:5-deoxy-glucuronate isomerase [Baekduia alba]|uniref:5-deoxy-glucuronate isomerase n=1 Tax=Baekduia alba TaxID=2997333 RepID=UPI0023425BAE|nr:5-deoxy-glucuronate isomerase [Baekduia alba]WCB94636.1 5-deoxy-glucuronate isomerase [Baekduia alba]
MSELLLHPAARPAADGTFLTVTPASAGWRHVGFEAITLVEGVEARRDTGDREVCVVVVEGTVDVASSRGDFARVGTRETPFDGRPDAVYLPADTTFTVTGTGEVGLCFAPASGQSAAPARLLPGGAIDAETRGHGHLERTVHPILMDGNPADALLVCEVITPPGHWSSYPPHKHDVDDPPTQTFLEETYYHRVAPARGFGLQRVYTDDRTLDETIAFGDRDCVLVPRGYHTVSAPPGYAVYYLNVMAGPVRRWAVANDPDHEWTLDPTSAA